MSTYVIAQHLNVAESAVTRIENWANCLFVVIHGLGARFVSKKVMENSNLAKKQEFSVIFNYPKDKKTFTVPATPGLYEIPYNPIRGLETSYINHDGNFFVWSMVNEKPGDYEITEGRKKPIVNGQLVVR